MATQSSQLIENLNLIYNEKLAQKTVLETTSDDFLMYHTYIAALKPSGYTSILQNGQVDVSSYKYAYVSVDGGGIVPSGSYTITSNGEYDIYNYATAVVEVDTSIPEGYVLPSGNIDLIQNGMVDVKEYAYATVAMPVPTGTVNITENGTAIDVSQYASANVAVPVPSGYVLPSGILEINENVIAADCSSYQYVTVDVEGGGGSGETVDPWYDFIQVYEMIENEETSADSVRSCICENFEYVEENGEYTISWDDIEEIETEELDENDNPIFEEVKIHVILTGDPHEIYAEGSNIASALEDYENLYYSINPILENATFTASEDPSEDGYDYLLEGDLYAWNLSDNSAPVVEITSNEGVSANYGQVGTVGNVNMFYAQAAVRFIKDSIDDSNFFTVENTLELPYDNGSAPSLIRMYPYYVCEEGPEVEELDKLNVCSWLANDGIMDDNTVDFVDPVYCSLMANSYYALTRLKFNSEDDTSGQDGLLVELILYKNWDSGNQQYTNEYSDININSANNVVHFVGSGKSLLLIPVKSGDNDYYFWYGADSGNNNYPIIYIYDAVTGQPVYNFTVVTSWHE